MRWALKIVAQIYDVRLNTIYGGVALNTKVNEFKTWFTQVESEGRSYRATPAANRAWTSAPGAAPPLFLSSRAPGQRAAPSCLTGRRLRRCAAQRALPGQPRERGLHSFSSSLSGKRTSSLARGFPSYTYHSFSSSLPVSGFLFTHRPLPIAFTFFDNIVYSTHPCLVVAF